MLSSSSTAVFIERVHQLLQAGYATITEKELKLLNTAEEPEITGVLADRIQTLIDGGSHKGISRAWSVGDNSPENESHLPLAKQKRGKKRKLPDLKFRFGGQRQAFYFRFEAKRLANSGAYADLISHEDGLGRFRRRIYSRDDSSAGLLGYVQIGTTEEHAAKIEAAFAAEPKKYGITQRWQAVVWKSGPPLSYRTTHSRAGNPGNITIYVTFLLFR